MVWVTNLFTGVRIFQSGKKAPTCEVCGSQLPGSLTWTLVHGTAVCECGAEYVCYHYDDEKRNILEKEPTCCVPEDLIPKYKAAWESSETKKEFFQKAKAISEEWNKTHPEVQDEEESSDA